ncbi:MAG: LCP family protein [Clostridia bacterium]|nr:LCP family protein [Clostridia bacterium]
MENKDNFDFDFNDKYEEIIAAMQKKQNDEYEDIVSDSSFKGGKHIYEDISSSSTGKCAKKSKGFKAWWKQLTRGKKALLISATSIVLVVAILLGWFFSYFKYNYNAITTDPDELGFTDVKEKGVINVALFGVDSRDETVFKGNTDSIMILSLNTNTKKVKIFSIMRDTLVPMEYNGDSYFAKINSAYSKGPEHAIKTINQAFDLDISEYATVNFYGMTDIIDAVGGITATITQDELTWKGHGNPNLNNCMDEICNEMGLNAKDYYIHTAGEQTLNGVQAVAYARVRHCTTVWGTRDDFGRTDRQRHVMQELFNKAITMKKTQYVSLIKALIPCSETSLSYSDVLGLAVNILLSSPTFEQYRLPPSEYQSEFLMTSPSGYGSIIYYDLDYAAKMINSIIYDDVTMEQYIELNPIERNNWYYEMTGTSGRKPSSTTSTPQTTTSSEQAPVESEEPEITSSEEDVSSEEDTSSEENVSSEDVSSEDSSSEDNTSGDISSDTPVESTDSSTDITTSDNSSSENTSSETPVTPPEIQDPTDNTTP